MQLSQVLPAAIVLRSPPEDLAGALLKHLNYLHQSGTKLNLTTFGEDSRKDYGQNDGIEMALKEVWAVLERDGYLTRDREDWYFISRKGEAALKVDSIDSFRVADLLPRKLLHPALLQSASGAFVRGDYPAAVFESYKAVEVAVRSAAKLPDSLLGTDLMRRAFNVANGELTDGKQLPAERQALSDLFAGAIGSYKNPHSHRTVKIEPQEAVEMIVLASHLLSIVDARKSLEE